MGCKTKRFNGRDSLFEFAIQCPEENPATTDFLPLGAVTTKGFSIESDVQTANDSFNSSGFTENQSSTASLPISVSGNFVRDPDSYPNEGFITDLLIYKFDSVKQDLSEDAVILVRITRPDVTLTAYMIINSISVDDPDAEFSTFSMELAVATSPIYPPTLVKTVA